MQISVKITIPDKDKCVFPNGDYCIGVQDLCSRCGVFDTVIEFGRDSYDPVKCKPCLELSKKENKTKKKKSKKRKKIEKPTPQGKKGRNNST